MRLGEKTKKALRIGAKVGSLGLIAVGAGQRLGNKESASSDSSSSIPQRTFEGKDFMGRVGDSRARGGSKGLVKSSASLAEGSANFADLASQMRAQSERRRFGL